MTITPTRVTAALAGLFSGTAWPLLWPLIGGAGGDDTINLIVGTVLLVAVPAHAFVVGFGPATQAGGLDRALLVRTAIWLVAAAGAAIVVGLVRGAT
ncbi:hypothetical protein [Piscinibacter koreensis]|uniref:Uncharacterized protein n=1 Tax=Piscinibacter koreensis TaxID=2742824 RepID=A0A7Y6NLN1_9BURK|nr:hypothetical protein [Schlegelella koreensis]NUZ05381.1 hypothetical protein [Schlegelella koreensis]